MTLISDGTVLTDNLKKSGRDMAWLKEQAAKRGASIQSTWLFMVDEGGNITFYPREDK